ncbi:MAG: hypothetical protein PHG03_05435 [Bacilli bacterium]|nr:hypothetical protein [Bacilli bacterium]
MNKNVEIATALGMHATKPENATFLIKLIKNLGVESDIIDEKKIYIELAYFKYSLSVICINVIAEKDDVRLILDETHKEIYNFLNKVSNIKINEFNKNCAERFNVYREINTNMLNKSNNEFTVLDCGKNISKIFLGITNPFLATTFIKFYTEEIKYLQNFITLLKGQEIEGYCKKLCEDIKLYYLKDFDVCCKQKGNWIILSDKSMKNYVLSRYGWAKNDKSDDLFLFMEKYPLTVNIIYSGSPGVLMIDTAIGIAKAELLDNFNESESQDDYILRIIECIKSQDWVIPFIRKQS